MNEVCTRQAYDEFGRRTFRWDYVPKGSAWDSTANASTRWDYRNPQMNPGFKTTVIAEWHAPRCDGNFVRKHYNGLGQLVAEQKADQDWALTFDGCTRAQKLNDIETLYGYNALGQQIQTSVPYRTSADWVARINNLNWTTVWNSTLNTATSYDALGRPTQTTAPNGEQSFYWYDGRVSSLYTKNCAKTHSQADAYRMNQWQEVDSLGYVANIRTGSYTGTDNWAENARVIFTHDATGNLTSVTHPNSIGTTTLSYDLLGHKLSMNDVDMGSWSYAYDRQGKLTRQTDARNQTTCLYYENVLERVSGKFFTTGASCSASVTSYDITYQYDQNQSSTNRSRGQLTYVTRNGWNKQIYYQAQGLLAEELVNIQSAPQSYATYYGYDAYWRPNVIVYPDGEWVTTTYNSMGLPNRLKSNQNGDLVDGLTASESVPNGVTYDEAGRVTQMRFPLGGNLYRTQQYAPFGQQDSNGGHLTSLKVGTNSNPANSDSWNHTYQNYWYDSFGNITQVDDQGAGTYSMSYDAQNRLINGYSLPYSYDSAGRLTNYENTLYTGYRGHGVTSSGGAQRTYYDANGNMVNRRWGLGNQQTLSWDAENQLNYIGGSNGYAEGYLYDADGQRVRSNNTVGGYTFYVNPHYEVTSEVPWVDDAIPGKAVVVAADDGWVWESGNPASGASYHRSQPKAGFHQHYFYGAAQPFKVNTGDVLYAYVYLDPTNPPSELMLQWDDSSSGWEHRAYWGQNLIGGGTNGTNSRRYMGALPSMGGWVRLEVPASQVGLEGVNVTGMAFTLYNGQAWWDRAGKRSNSWLTTKYYTFNGQRIAMRDETGLYYLHQDQLGSTLLVTNGSGNTIADHGYYAYGRDRRGSELHTAQRFTGQLTDGTGLVYMNARYYDPQLGQFISPDTLVPDATQLMDFNRYAYARGNPMKYNDPSGHCVFAPPIDTIGCVLLGAALLLQGDDTKYQPTTQDVNSQRLGGALMTAGAAGLLVDAATAATAATTCAVRDCDEASRVTQAGQTFTQAGQTATQSVWQLNPFQRGVAIENMLGRSSFLSQNFPVIDRFENGIATSIKSIDLGAKNYQNLSTLTRTVQGYINEMANWQGQPRPWGGVTILPSQIVGRALELAISPNATTEQTKVLQQLQQTATNVGVTLNIVTIK